MRRALAAPDMMGNLVYVGGLPLEEAHDIHEIDGAIVGEELAHRLPRPEPVPRSGTTFVELHIEQGRCSRPSATT